MTRSTLEEDVRDLAGFGYRQRLNRTLGAFSTFAAGFSYLSVLTGSSQLFYLGYGAGGPAFFWTWPVVFAGQFLVALCFAEMAARYPLSGGVYQWSRRVGSDRLGWMTGWIYLAGSVITLASTSLALQTILPQFHPLFQIIGSATNPDDVARNAVLLGCGMIGFTTFLNAYGVQLLARVNNAGVVAEMLGVILLILFLALAARRGPSVVLTTGGREAGHALGYLGPMLTASLMAAFVMYGFDTAGSLAEETDNPRRRAPIAILTSLGSVGVAGSCLVLTALMAAPDLDDPALSSASGGLAHVVKTVMGASVGPPFLAVMAVAIIVCCLTVHAAAVRLLFSMARDNLLPFSAALARIDHATRTPLLPALVIGAASALLLILNIGSRHVIESLASVSVVWANLAYLSVTAPLLFRRFQGRHGGGDHLVAEGLEGHRGFAMGRAGLAVNLAAVAWGCFLIVNIGWPREIVYGDVPYARLGAAPVTIAMLAAGWTYGLLARQRRGGIVAEHRIVDLVHDSIDAIRDDPERPIPAE